MTSLGQLSGDIMQTNIEASDVPMVQVSSHWGARESHAAWQGGIYTLEQFRAVCGYGEPSNPDHIYSYNCRHSHYPYWPGVSEPIEFDQEPAPVTVNGKTYTYYQATQKQRNMERQIRALKREVNAGGDKAVLGSQIRQKTQEYNVFSRAVDIRPKAERLRVVGYDGTSGGMFRQTGNSGAFSVLPERMSKKHIREVAKEAGVSLKGLTIVIDRDEEKLAEWFPYTGRADQTTIGRIDLFAKAFYSKDELTRTIFHEKMHVEQYRQYGVAYVIENTSYFEEITKTAENEFISRLGRGLQK